jgi:glycosyltransferase involved in cell wall biosynthesis
VYHKVLHLIPSVDPKAGGTVEALMQLIGCSEDETLFHEIASLDTAEEVDGIHEGKTIHTLGPTRSFYGYSKRFDEWLETNITNYAIVVIHGCWQYHGLAGFRACSKHKIPYVQYPHGMLDPWFKKHYPLKHLKKWLYWPWAEFRILKNANRVIFTTEEERDLSYDSFALYKVNPEVIPLGINEPPYSLAECISIWLQSQPDLVEEQYLIFLSRIHEKKGVDDLIKAVDAINREWDHTSKQSITMLVVGPCDDAEYLRRLKSEASKIDFSGPIKKFLWVDMIRDEQKWGALAGAEAFILPSHQENFGMVVPEALCCSTPVLISSKVNIWKEVKNNKAGYVEEDGVEGTKALLNRWLSTNFKDKEQLRTNARIAFEKEFLMHKNAKRVFALLSSIIRENNEANTT